MPASQVMGEFKSGTLRSGSKSGPLVTNPKQARAIQISEARKEGKDIPLPSSKAPAMRMPGRGMPSPGKRRSTKAIGKAAYR